MRLLTPVFFICSFFTTQGQVDPFNDFFPGFREQATLVYHPKSNGLLLIGGFPLIPDSTESDAWKWDQNKWTKVASKGPGSRYFFYGGLNSITGNIELFAGTGIGEYSDLRKDLWAFDGANWSVIPSDDIGTRDHHTMIYADNLDAFVLYGGVKTDRSYDTTTWLLRKGKFESLDIPGPGVRYHSAMVYDKRRKKVVLYGGGDHPEEHWEFDGKKWDKIERHVNPGVRYNANLVYDEQQKLIILHGGRKFFNSPENFNTQVTWSWDGKEWKKITEADIFPIGMAYHPGRKSVIAYGFTAGDPNAERNIALWELKNNSWKKIADYGKWCPIQYLEKYLEKRPDDLDALLRFTNYTRNANRFAEAERAFKKIETIKPGLEKTAIGMIDVLIRQQKIDEAKEWLAKVDRRTGNTSEFYANLGGSLSSAGQYAWAIKYYEKSLSLKPGGREYYNLGCLYSLIGNTDKAFEALSHAVEHGYNAKSNYERDSDLNSLHSDDRWNELLNRLKA